MSTFRTACAAAALLALPLLPAPASAAPVSSSVALSAPYAGAINNDVTQVQYYRRRGPNPGAIIGGLAAGAIIGGIVASQARPYYGPGYYAPPPPVYYQPAPQPYYAPSYGGGGDAEAYCMQRYRSYDPRSGTYLNNDGNRYPCP